jgi:hypothetical protein
LFETLLLGVRATTTASIKPGEKVRIIMSISHGRGEIP